jgi:hypothetical protein
MLNKAKHKEQKDMDSIERKEAPQKYIIDSMGDQQLPFHVLLQIMKAYSDFPSNGTIRNKSI